jgi:hypothetical protein
VPSANAAASAPATSFGLLKSGTPVSPLTISSPAETPLRTSSTLSGFASRCWLSFHHSARSSPPGSTPACSSAPAVATVPSTIGMPAGLSSSGTAASAPDAAMLTTESTTDETTASLTAVNASTAARSAASYQPCACSRCSAAAPAKAAADCMPPASSCASSEITPSCGPEMVSQPFAGNHAGVLSRRFRPDMPSSMPSSFAAAVPNWAVSTLTCTIAKAPPRRRSARRAA